MPLESGEKRLENTKIFVGTDTAPFSTVLTECFSGAYDGGFKTLSLACRDGTVLPYNVVSLRRETFTLPPGPGQTYMY